MRFQCSVGKTSLLQSFVGEELQTTYKATQGADFRSVDVTMKDLVLNIQLWESAEQRELRSILRGSDGLMLVYDITDRRSFDALQHYWNQFMESAGAWDRRDFPCIIVGNKADLHDQIQVTHEQVRAWCHETRPERPIPYIECSARSGENVGPLFRAMCSSLYEFVTEEEGSVYDILERRNSLDEESSRCEPCCGIMLFWESFVGMFEFDDDAPLLPFQDPPRTTKPKRKTTTSSSKTTHTDPLQ